VSGVIRYLRLGEVLAATADYRHVDGSPDYGDIGLLEEQFSQLRQTFSGVDSYPPLIESCSSWLFPNQKTISLGG